jgi:hypothetical protein
MARHAEPKCGAMTGMQSIPDRNGVYAVALLPVLQIHDKNRQIKG